MTKPAWNSISRCYNIQSTPAIATLTQIADLEQKYLNTDSYPNIRTNMFSNLFNFQKQKGEQDHAGGGGKEPSSKAKLSGLAEAVKGKKNKNKKQQQQQQQQSQQPQQLPEPQEEVEEEIQVRI